MSHSSCDGKAKFSAAIPLVFSDAWSFRNHSADLPFKKHFLLLSMLCCLIFLWKPWLVRLVTQRLGVWFSNRAGNALDALEQDTKPPIIPLGRHSNGSPTAPVVCFHYLLLQLCVSTTYCSGCVFPLLTAPVVSTKLDGLNAEDKFQEWVIILGLHVIKEEIKIKATLIWSVSFSS